MLTKEILIETSICCLYSFIGVVVYVIYVYYNDTYKLELFDKIFIPIVYIVIANIVLSFINSSIYELYINLKYFIKEYIYKSFILCLLINLLSLFITFNLTLLLVKIIVHLICLIFKRYWIHVGPYILIAF